MAPLGVLENADGWQKLNLTKEQIETNLKSLLSHPDFAERMRGEHENRPEFPAAADPEGALYEGFLNDKDAFTCNLIRNAKPSELADLHPEFIDERLPDLLLHYKAKSFPKSLSEDEQAKWETYRTARLNRQAPDFLKQLETLSQSASADDFLLEELSLWYQSLL